MQDFASAADIYGQLVQVVPEVDEYKIYHAARLETIVWKGGIMHFARQNGVASESKRTGSPLSALTAHSLFQKTSRHAHLLIG